MTFENCAQAARKLGGGAFKFYLFLEWSVTTLFNYSRLAVCKEMGLNYRTVNDAFEELCQQSYLQKIEEGIYTFSSSPT